VSDSMSLYTCMIILQLLLLIGPVLFFVGMYTNLKDPLFFYENLEILDFRVITAASIQ